MELSCSFDCTCVLSCSSDVTGGRSHPKNSLPPLFLCCCFSCPFLARASLVADVILVVFLSYNYPLRDFFFFILGACPFPSNIAMTFRVPFFFFFFDVSLNMFFFQTVLFPGEFCCVLTLWTSNIKNVKNVMCKCLLTQEESTPKGGFQAHF